jgi:hypothetical protein
MSRIPTISKSAAIAWAGGTPSQLAERLGVTVSAVSQWGENDLPEGRVWQLVALGFPVADESPQESA